MCTFKKNNKSCETDLITPLNLHIASFTYAQLSILILILLQLGRVTPLRNVLSSVYDNSLWHTSTCPDCPKRTGRTACVGVHQQLNGANNEFLLGFCTLMVGTDLASEWSVNMHRFWREAGRHQAGPCTGRRSKQK